MVVLAKQEDTSMKSRLQDPSLLDVWLRREFKSLYDAALDEPIPDELVRLLAGSSDRS